jgi:ribose/xylose/arabinose/galactoside ABC-type transport system permease subunit
VLNILQVAAFLGVIATGQTLVLLAGGIDLSQAGIVTLTNIVATAVMNGDPANIAPAVLVCLALAAGIGLLNGLLVTALRITPLIATLGMSSILFGAALVFTGGAPHGAAAPGFTFLGQGHVGPVPSSTLVWLVLALAAAWASRNTVAGRWLYAAGANPEAAALMGVPVRGVTIGAFVGSALLAGIGGLLLTAYIGAPSLGIGTQFMFTAIAAPVVGGTALTGGVGSLVGTIAGTLLVTELASFTNIVRVSSGTQQVLQGVIIALSVILYGIASRQGGRPPRHQGRKKGWTTAH